MYSNEKRNSSTVVSLDTTNFKINGEKGRIFVNGQLFLTGVKRPEELVWNTPEADKFFENEDFSKYFMYLQPEGPLLRVYKIDNEWYISTPGKLDAFKSYWGSSYSFGKIFVNFLFDIYGNNVKENFWDCLDSNLGYYFYLRPTRHNRLVCAYDSDSGKDALIFAGVMPIKTDNMKEFIWANCLTNTILPDIKRIHQIVYLYESKVQPEVALTCVNRETGRIVKIWNTSYSMLRTLRGNDPFPLRQYCYYRLIDQNKADQFLQFFPQKATYFKGKYIRLMQLAQDILRGVFRPEYVKIYNQIGSDQYFTQNEVAFQIIANVSWQNIIYLI